MQRGTENEELGTENWPGYVNPIPNSYFLVLRSSLLLNGRHRISRHCYFAPAVIGAGIGGSMTVLGVAPPICTTSCG